MLTFAGLFIVLVVVALLLSNRVTPIVALTVVPVVGALIAGFGFHDIATYFNSGLSKVMSVAVMFIFAILYFGIMKDIGLFNPIINKMILVTRGNVVAITIGTVVIAAIAHLDGSGASTFLITIPALLPLYQRLKMSPYLLLLLIGASASIMNMLPWGGPVGRVASVLGVDPTALWQPLIPLQGIAMVLLLALATILGFREKRRIKANNAEVVQETHFVEPKATESKNLLFNLALTVGLIAVLVTGIIPSALVFMIGVSIALTVNFPSVKAQMEKIKEHSPGAMLMASIIVAAGVFLGILKGSGMLNAIAVNLVSVLPTAVVSNLHIIVGFFGVPFELLLSTDAHYYALFPVVQQVVELHGVTASSAAYAVIIGNVIGTFVSPFSPALWLAVGLANIEMGKHIKYSLGWIWGLSIVLLIFGMIIGLY